MAPSPNNVNIDGKLISISPTHLEPADLVEVVPAALPAAAPGAGVVRPQVVAGQGRVKHHCGRGGRVTLQW